LALCSGVVKPSVLKQSKRTELEVKGISTFQGAGRTTCRQGKKKRRLSNVRKEEKRKRIREGVRQDLRQKTERKERGDRPRGRLIRFNHKGRGGNLGSGRSGQTEKSLLVVVARKKFAMLTAKGGEKKLDGKGLWELKKNVVPHAQKPQTNVWRGGVR